jgi:1-acyl-sn-glycerol-3-phosphate acyltransferase
VGVSVRFWGKDTLFRIPLFGRWLRWLGGVPVDRHHPKGVVGQAVDHLRQCKQAGRYFWLGLAPEGTRRRTEGWRSGFYQTAHGADVPLGLIQLDYGSRTVRVLDFIRLQGDPAQDMARIAALYQGVSGLRPAGAAPVRLLAPLARTDTIEP